MFQSVCPGTMPHQQGNRHPPLFSSKSCTKARASCRESVGATVQVGDKAGVYVGGGVSVTGGNGESVAVLGTAVFVSVGTCLIACNVGVKIGARFGTATFRPFDGLMDAQLFRIRRIAIPKNREIKFRMIGFILTSSHPHGLQDQIVHMVVHVIRSLSSHWS